MKKWLLIPLIALLFGAICVGAYNVLGNTNNRPYRLHEFISDVSSINFDYDLLSSSSGYIPFSSIDSVEWSDGYDGVDVYYSTQLDHGVYGGRTHYTTLEFVFYCFTEFFIEAIDFVINIGNFIFSVLKFLGNFLTGVPV